MERRVPDRVTGLFALMAVCTAAGSVLAALYPGWAVWQMPLCRQGMGIVPDGRLLCECMIYPLVYLGISALLGLSAWGEAGGLLLALRGMMLGGVLTGLYRTGGAAGVMTAVLFVVPYACAAGLVQAAGVCRAGENAGCMRRMLTGRDGSADLRRYLVFFGICAGSLTVLGLMQCVWLHLAYPAFLGAMTGR